MQRQFWRLIGVGRPFEYILDQLDLPQEMAGVGGQVCLAEETLNGVQVAVEGYEHDGEITVYGVLDSINYPDSCSLILLLLYRVVTGNRRLHRHA
ncbi:hypothetical protein [Streptomyces mirabilis]|uniref:hypothetical protein n=1 Tax=Streptomyces mirabilis TaxID=68239 RepID=UPI003F4B6647